MLIDKLLNLIEEHLPSETAMQGDRIGLQVQSGVYNVKSILVALELNNEVLDEAIANNCNCIITFHPLIFNPLESILNSDRVGRLCSGLIKNGIALVAVHTIFDSFAEGTSNIFATKLGLKVTGFLKPDENYKGCGMGVIAEPETSLASLELVEMVAESSCSPVRYTIGRQGNSIKKIGIVGGSGISFIDDVIEQELDAFITADVKYHDFHRVIGDILLIDPGHYEMEQYVPEGLVRLLRQKIEGNDKPDIRMSTILTNPVNYFPDNSYKEIQKKYLINNK